MPMRAHFLREYTDCQLRTGLLSWLVASLPPSSRGLDARVLADRFEKQIYQEAGEGSTLVEKYFSEIVSTGKATHLGIARRRKPGSARTTAKSLSAGRTAAEDILSWAASFGLLTSPSVRQAYALTKTGLIFRKLLGEKTAQDFSLGNSNPLAPSATARRFLFLEEVEQDCVILLLIQMLSTEFREGETFIRSGDQGKHVVRLFIRGLQRVWAAQTAERNNKEAKQLLQHIAQLSEAIGDTDQTRRRPRNRLLTKRATRQAASYINEPSASFKMPKHRITPRLEHLVDYGFLAPTIRDQAHDQDAKEFSWMVTQTGHRAADFMRSLPQGSVIPDNNSSQPSPVLPAIGPFILEHAMAFIACSEALQVKRMEKEDYLECLQWAYDRCGQQYGYSEFLGLAKVAALHALETGRVMEIGDLYRFLREEVPGDARLSKAIRFASRPEPESMHLRIITDALKR